MNIYKKLFNIQQELKCDKGQYNEFGNYKYRSCEDILNAVKPLLKENNLIILLNDEVQEVGGKNYIKATAKLIDIETGESIDNSAIAREDEDRKKMDSPQITGSCSSYARKYALNGLLAIDDVKDSDATNKHGKDQKQPQKAANVVEIPTDKNIVTSTEINFIYSRGLQAGYTQDEIRTHVFKKFGKGIQSINKVEAAKIVEGYQQRILKKMQG